MNTPWFHLRRLLARPSVSEWLYGKVARPRGRSALRVEELETRLAPSTYIVQTNGNVTGPVTPAGAGVFNAPTLRAAVDAANLAGGTNTITFAAAVAGGTITLTTNDTTNPFAFGPTALVVGRSPGSPD